ncbi:hypothetical protein K440DRAFT_622929 [Wilcoxina mikolae CBS 423.85]|nr:hypothetical protein K440DRAFT_622929 [Wilcoxina mikolae CBS 423.85]
MATTVERLQILPTCSPPMPSQALFSSSPLPSPSAVLREISKKALDKAKQSKPVPDITDIWEIPDSEGEQAELSPAPKPKTRRKPAAKSTDAPAKVRGRKTKAKDATDVLSTKSTNADVKAGLKSKFFAVDSPKMTVRKTSVRKATASTATTAPKATRKKAEPKLKAKKVAEPVPQVIPETTAAASPSPPPPSPSPVFRRQWTPVRDTADTPTDRSPPTEETLPKFSFGDKIGALIYRSQSSEKQEEQRSTSDQPEERPSLTKKRRIEMIELPNARAKPNETARETKKPRKKAQTITERASAPYRKTAPSPSSITEYFSASKKSAGSSITAKPSLKPLATTKRKRKDEEADVNLLSPVSAKRRIENQGFVFGTCSQLENELIEEEDCYGLPPVASGDVARASAGSFMDQTTPTGATLTTLAGAKCTGGLWNAANRDLDGGLLGKDDFDLSGRHKVVEVPGDTSNQRADPPPASIDNSEKPSENADIESIIPSRQRTTIDLTLSSSPAPAPATETLEQRHSNIQRQSTPLHNFCPSSPGNQGVAVSISAPKLPPNLPLDLSPPVTMLKRSLSTSSAAADKKSRSKTWPSRIDSTPLPLASEPEKVAQTTTEGPRMPDFSTYLTTQLQTELSKFGFKKIGSRAAMISTMEQCWKAQNPTSQPEDDGIASPITEPVSSPQSPPRSRAKSASVKPRSRAASKVPTIPEEERVSPKKRSCAASKAPTISEEEETVSPKKRSRAGSGKAKKPSTATRAKKKPARDPLETQRIYVKISEAVEAMGKSGGTDNFYFKILMYDPIILEDLTVWLNTVGLTSVGIDEEVTESDTRSWCDQNGVCCLAKETQKGLERKRY